jgi:tetratricopeptide (TPR) repeat protein
LDPPSLSEDSKNLKQALSAFFRGDYEPARRGLATLEARHPSERRLLPLLGATHLREGNFSMARDYYGASLAPPLAGPGLKAASEVGLALALFNLMDLEGALPPARSAYQARLSQRGEGDPQTMSAANVLAAVLVGLGRNPEGEAILEGSLRASLSAGLDPESPLIVDSLNLLSLSYKLGQSDKDVFALLGGEPAGPAAQAGGRAPGGDPAGAPGGGGGRPKGPRLPDFDFPAALSLYNDLSQASPKSALRPALLLSMIAALGQAELPCQDPGEAAFRESLWHLCVDLAGSLLDAYLPPPDPGLGERLLAWREIDQEPRAFLAYDLAALAQALSDDPSKAEPPLRKALGALARKERLSPAEASFLALRSVTLAELLLSQGRPPIEAEIELTGSVTAIERALPKGDRDRSLELPFLYWFLARTQRDLGRPGDSRRNFQKAEKAVQGLAKAYPGNAPELARLGSLLKGDLAHRARKKGDQPPGFPNSPRIFYPAYLEQGARAQQRVQPPGAMRVELEALRFLGRPQDFGPLIQRALAATPEGSPNRLPYESLNLKYLEAIGDHDSLLAGLRALYDQPKGEDEGQRSLFRASVKSYEGRIRKARGDAPGALAAFREALGILSALPGSEDRVAELQKEMADLEGGGQDGEDPAIEGQASESPASENPANDSPASDGPANENPANE